MTDAHASTSQNRSETVSPIRRAHWVVAHPRRASLNGRLFDSGTSALATRAEVTSTDLYADAFDPRLGIGDLGSNVEAPGNFAELAGRAVAAGEAAPEVAAEQLNLTAADLLVLQFPLWWYGPPAIMKGWLDRVLTDGFAYGGYDDERGVPRRYGDGGMAGKRALVIVTAGEDAGSIGPRGVSGDLEQVLFPLTHGTLWYCGFDVLDLHVVHDADGLGAEGGEREAARLVARLDGLDHEHPVPLRRLRDGDYDRTTRALRADLAPGRTDLGIHRVDA
ncbi:MAG: NAD(P)H-dependent oxidoreductase [Pseudoclavibacter sp.]